MQQFLRAIPWRGRDALVVFFVPWILLPLATEIILQLLAPDYAPFRIFLQAYDKGDVRASFVFVLLDALSSFLLIRYYLRKYSAKVGDLGWRGFNLFKAILYIILIPIVFGILLSLALGAAQSVVPGFDPNQTQANEFTQNKAPKLQIYNLLALVILPPILEETVFRGFMFPAFSRRYGAIVGALISSALFGFAHLQGNVSIYTFILGLLLCGLYYRLGSIFPGMGLHMLNNYFAFMAISSK